MMTGTSQRGMLLACLALAVALATPVTASTHAASLAPALATAATQISAEPRNTAPGQPRADAETPGLHRCIGSDGSAIFTDRACRDLQATDAPPPSADRLRPAALVRARTCARSQDDLVFGVRTALEAHDPNKLAEYYHWTGMGNSEGYRLMGRLASFSERPVLDVQLVSSAQVGTPMPPLPPPPPLDDEYALDDELGPYLEPAPPAPPPRTRADLLRVDQMRSEKDFESQVTYFRLRSNAGCWWLQF